MKTRDLILLSLLSAIIYVFAFPGLSLPVLAFIALVPLFVALFRAPSPRIAFLIGFVFGMTHIIVMTYWLYYAIHVHYGGSLLVTALIIIGAAGLPVGLHAGVFSLGYAYFKSDRPLFFALIVPSLWIIVDYLRILLPITLPWGLPGYAVVDIPLFVQFADLLGLPGVTFVIVFINAMFARVLMQALALSGEGSPRDRCVRLCDRGVMLRLVAENRFVISALVLAILLPVLYGVYALNRWDHVSPKAPGVSAAFDARIVQGNHGHKERWSDDTFFGRLDTYTALSNENHRSEAKRIVVWPETVLNSANRVSEELLQKLIAFMGRSSVLIAGGIRRAPGDAYYNSVYVLSGGGYVNWYDKNILLPFSETKPLSINTLGRYYEAPDEFAMGTTPPVARSDHAVCGLSICFELIYPWFVRKSVNAGADILVNVSNDAWFGDSSEPFQHLNMARFRCIESRRYMLRASNSGISAIIGPTGEIIAHSSLFTRGAIDGKVRTIRERPVYATTGDVMVICALIAVLCMLLATLFRSRSSS